jgi:2,4-dienoyl-CoA reductase-like NADH-dependent reductase (Old Yellow Enzyme family)
VLSQDKELLFSHYTLRDLVLPNRIVMAPLTRSRAAEEGVPTPPMAEYYAQRASTGTHHRGSDTDVSNWRVLPSNSGCVLIGNSVVRRSK